MDTKSLKFQSNKPKLHEPVSYKHKTGMAAIGWKYTAEQIT